MTCRPPSVPTPKSKSNIKAPPIIQSLSLPLAHVPKLPLTCSQARTELQRVSNRPCSQSAWKEAGRRDPVGPQTSSCKGAQTAGVQSRPGARKGGHTGKAKAASPLGPRDGVRRAHSLGGENQGVLETAKSATLKTCAALAARMFGLCIPTLNSDVLRIFPAGLARYCHGQRGGRQTRAGFEQHGLPTCSRRFSSTPGPATSWVWF